ILLAEDNSVNQEIASRQLAKLGVEVDVVGNGRAAVEALARTSYDVVLMDCQMPEMDGFTATGEVRRREVATGRHTPIIAMTASALAGDREQCLRAGMDDYLSKPVKLEKLREVLAHWAGVQAAPSTPGAAVEATGEVVDLGALEELRSYQLEGETDTLDRLIAKFLDSARDECAEARAALTRGDPETIRRAVHGLKISSSMYGARRLSALNDRIADRAERQDALPDQRPVHRAQRDALHVRDLHGVDARRRVRANRLQEPPLPSRVEEVEHVPPAPARRPRDLARVGERIDEREVLAQGMDHLDGEADAGRRRLRKETRVRVAIGARGRLPRGAVPPPTDDEERVAVQAMHPLDGAPEVVIRSRQLRVRLVARRRGLERAPAFGRIDVGVGERGDHERRDAHLGQRPLERRVRLEARPGRQPPARAHDAPEPLAVVAVDRIAPVREDRAERARR